MFPKQRSDVTVRQVDGEWLILDHKAEQIHQLNVTAGYIWNRCDGATSLGDIAKAVTAEFGGDDAPVAADVVRMVEHLKALDLLESA